MRSKLNHVYTTFLLLLAAILFTGYFSNPPNGNTGAPGDALCINCHSPGNPNGFDGEIIIENFPAAPLAGQEYFLTARVTNPNGLAFRGGFQAVVLDGSNMNAGDLMVTGLNPTTQMSGSREYVEHNPGLDFPGSNEISWDFSWVAPNGPNGETITIYAAGNITNGNSETDGDFVVTTNVSGILDATNIPLEVEIISSSNVSCNGGNDGAASAAASGGTGPYTYSWSNGASGATVTNLTAGTHTVTATDAMNETATVNVTITEPPILDVVITSQTNITCINNTGSATALASGGTTPYSYNWPSGGTSATETGLSAGSYTLTVSDDHQCTATTTVTIIEDITPPVADAGPDQQLNCNTSVVILDGSGSSTGPVEYLWSTFDGLLCGGETTPLASACAPGTYELIVTFTTNGCSESDLVIVTEIPEVDLSISGTNVSCFGGNDGAIDLTVSGGEGPYDFDWDDNTLDGVEDPSGLTAGTYCVIVTDNVGCADMICVTLNQPTEINISGVETNVSCNGSCDGSITVDVTGGTPSYTYQWTGPNGFTATNLNIMGLCPGEYILEVTDQNNCTAQMAFTIEEPFPISISANVTNASCNGVCNGSIDATVTGGTPPYSYEWDTTPVQPSQDINNLCAGVYTLIVTDANDCTTISAFTVTEPSVINLAFNVINPTCTGLCNGTIELTVSGGTPGYTFLWSNDSTQIDLPDACAGTFSVTVTDSNGCTGTGSATVEEPEPNSITSSVSDATCNGSCDGAIDLTVTGGTPPYNFNWDSGLPATEDQSDLCAGTYSVTVTDANDCSAVHNATVDEPAPLVIELISQSTSCPGSCDGSISATTSGGTGPYVYEWNTIPIQTGPSAVNLCAGPYEVMVTDENGCTDMAFISVEEPAPFEISGIITSASCADSCDGSIDVTITGGTSPYSYDWDNASTTEDQTGLCAGLYTLVITDDNGCTAITSFTIDEPLPLVATATTTDVSCNGVCDGTANVTVSGGTAPYSYEWSGPCEGANPVDICAGTFSVTITDANGCTTSETVTINEPEPLELNPILSHVDCNGNCNGSIDLTVSGGTAPYTYLWSTGSGEEDILGLCAGSYSVTVTDANDCTAIAIYTIEQPPVIILSLSSTNETANGTEDGTATANPSGGVGGFTFQWNDPANQITQIATGLAPGNYCVIVTDSNGCTAEACVTVNPFDCTLEVDITVQNVLCHGEATGSATADANGGSGPYTYAWSTGGNEEMELNLTAGSHSLTVTDSDGCVVIQTFDITEPPAITITGEVTGTTCGQCNGAVDITVLGGTSPYTFIWSAGLGTSEDIFDLCSGEYSILVTDTNGCEAMATFIVVEGSLPVLSVTSSNETTPGANDGTATASPTSGNPPYVYSWNNGATTQTITGLSPGEYCVTVTDSDGCTATGCTTVEASNCNLEGFVTIQDPICGGGNDGIAMATISGGMEPYIYNWSSGGAGNPETGLSAGVYMVTVTDDEGCTFTTTFIVGEPQPIIISAQTTDVSCNGLCDGTVDLTVTGGTAPYEYAWSGPCEGPNPVDICAGSYTVTVTDVNGCTGTLDITISEPEILSLEVEITHILCGGECTGAIDLNILGGTEPYFIEWSTGSGEEDILGLCSNSYGVLVTDANGCTISGVYSVNENPILIVSVSSTNETAEGANDGTATANVSGGTPGFTYLWSTGATTQTISGLAPGNYCVTVTDSNGCTASACTTILPFGCSLSLDISDDNFTCPDFCNGTIDLTISGAEEPITINWSNGYTGEDPFDLCEGTYSVTVSDANGCTATASTTVNASPSMTLEFEYSGSNCSLPCDGMIDLTVTNGMSPHSYEWTDGDGNVISNEEDLTSVCQGTYTVLVTDANGCTVEASPFLITPDPLQATIIVTDATCFSLCDGTIDLVVIGGVPPYSYEWSGGLPPDEDQTNVCAGTYEVTISDSDGCSTVLSITVGEPTDLEIVTLEITNPTCYEECDGSATILVSGGTFPYTFSGPTEDLCAGTYTTTVTDANGCTAIESFTIVEPPELIVEVIEIGHEMETMMDGFIEITSIGGTSPYTYEWWLDGSVVSTDEDPTGLSAGVYELQITDANGCVLVISDIILDNIVAISQIQLNNAIKVFPNPSSGIVQVAFDLQEASLAELEVFDFMGRLIITHQESNVYDQMIPIDLSDFNDGVYTLKIKIENAFVIEKVIKYSL